ncbi:MAG: RNA methyltransferase [Ruminococcaceae bacterium]|nr:RNA methyltransferase [Oscillospiraceae bacterium]
MIKEITSTQNGTYKLVKSLKTKKARVAERKYTVEGIKSVRDAIEAGADIDFIVASDKFSGLEFDNGYVVPESIFAGLCDTDTPQGVLAVINMQAQDNEILDRELYLYCDRVTDPGNMGTIIRICDACDAGLLLSPGCVDIYNPKTVRSSMGSFFHTPVLEVSYESLSAMKDNGYRIISGALCEKTLDYKDADYGGKTVIVVGNEANGICDEVLELSHSIVKIPIFGRAESLNVGVSAAILLYEARRKQ